MPLDQTFHYSCSFVLGEWNLFSQIAWKWVGQGELYHIYCTRFKKRRSGNSAVGDDISSVQSMARRTRRWLGRIILVQVPNKYGVCRLARIQKGEKSG